MPDEVDPYKILQVDHEAEDEVIQAAYRRLARKYHPDLAESADAAARMAGINAAWELIGDPEARRAFDRSRATTYPTPEPTGPANTSPGGSGSPSPARGKGNVPPRPTPRPEVVSPDWTSG